MPLMVTIQPWVFIITCWSRQRDFNLVHHPTPEKWFFFYYSEKRYPQAGFEPRTPTMNPEHTHTLNHSTIVIMIQARSNHRGIGMVCHSKKVYQKKFSQKGVSKQVNKKYKSEGRWFKVSGMYTSSAFWLVCARTSLLTASIGYVHVPKTYEI